MVKEASLLEAFFHQDASCRFESKEESLLSNFVQFELLLLSIAFVAATWGVISYQRKKDALNWKNIDGEIIKRFNRVRMHGSSTDLFLVTFKITYRYVHKGTEYFNSQYCDPADNANTNEELIERMNGKFAIGARITVYFNPKHPRQSSIHRIQPAWHLLGFLVSFLCILFGIIYWWAS